MPCKKELQSTEMRSCKCIFLDAERKEDIPRAMENELPEGIGSRFGDLKDLPEELLRQIPATRIDDIERAVIDLLRENLEGAGSVDEILVGLYRKTGVIHDRGKLASKLYRMVQGKPPLLNAVEKKRGVYRLPE